ncbi:tyrosine-type recombinase/integrase [Azospirillum halopraeferens]|uniref:tyrosine-type recombinase/integrase n=1 Tax=Azospirillum halopraeferens TaxID=34010 RepID=UPI000A0656C5|nr:tyrosine-type recombinase/integrase [Azospirillum halopraeferens]
MATLMRGLPVDKWPPADRVRWMTVRQTLPSAAERRARQAYGRFLAWAAAVERPADKTSGADFSDTVLDTFTPGNAHELLKGLVAALQQLRPDDSEAWKAVLLRKRVALASTRGGGRSVRPKPASLRVLAFQDWPADEQDRWHAGLSEPGLEPQPIDPYARFLLPSFDGKISEAATGIQPWRWSASTRMGAELGWGRWCRWVQDQGVGRMPTPDTFGLFLDSLAARCVAPKTLAKYAADLRRALCILAPNEDWEWLAKRVGLLVRRAKPVLNKRSRRVPLSDLHALGIGLMAAARRQHASVRAAVHFRDGLFIALLTWRPKRVGSIAALELGSGVMLDAAGVPESIRLTRTKNGRVDEGPVPDALKPALKVYLEVYRPILLLDASQTNSLFVTQQGKPLSQEGLRGIMVRRTQEEFGIAITPHLFRTFYSTELSSWGVDIAHLLSTMLGHTDSATLAHYRSLGEASFAARLLETLTETLRVRGAILKPRAIRPSK